MSRVKCPHCDGHLVLRKGPYSEFYGCSNFPECRYTWRDTSGNGAEPNELNMIPCFDCEGNFVVRTGKSGQFYGCTKYPKCRCTAYICPQCGMPMISFFKCSECDYERPMRGLELRAKRKESSKPVEVEDRALAGENNSFVYPAVMFDEVMRNHFDSHLAEKVRTGSPGYTLVDGDEEAVAIFLSGIPSFPLDYDDD